MAKQMEILCSESTLYNAWSVVKAKGAAGGIDGVTIQEFEKEKRKQIPMLVEELKSGTWKPYPYLEIEIPKSKDPAEKRKLGMIAIRDKIVQQAIRAIIEPRYDRIFVGNSYGYRPGKGATKAIKRVLAECKNKKYKYVLRLDIDNFFDTIDHFLLRRRLAGTGTEEEIIRLIMLCMQMGKVKQKSREWIDTEFGTPQGAILSPLLSNLYLHSFDQFAISRHLPYIRYADDFLFLCENKEQAQELAEKTELYLNEKLKLSLNKPISIISLSDKFEFLGITIKQAQACITEKKREELNQRILSLELCKEGFDLKSESVWKGISNYYAMLLPENDLESFDAYLLMRLQDIVNNQSTLFNSKTSLQTALAPINFLSKQYQARKKLYIGELVADYATKKNQFALVKYFNKYHKNHYPHLGEKLAMVEQEAEAFRQWRKVSSVSDGEFMQKLIGHESQMAIRYWDYIRELIADDEVDFSQREHQGAKDLFNSMLNYGYAILYVRVWQALLAAKLNPYNSIIHARQEGKPTLVYDMVEIFRSQIVDRVVISLIQKGQDLEVRNGLLTDKTRQLLVKSVMERLARYEKYQGEEIKMELIILRQAKLLAKAFEGTEKFKPYVAKW